MLLRNIASQGSTVGDDTVWRIPAGLPFSCVGVLDSRIVILSRSLAFVTVGVIELVV